MTRLTVLVLAALAASPSLALAQKAEPGEKPGATAPARDSDASKYVGNSGRLSPNSDAVRTPSNAGKTETSADDPSLNAGIGAVPSHERRSQR